MSGCQEVVGFELEAQPLVFYSVINVRGGRCEGSVGEKCSRCSFHICELDGIICSSEPQSEKEEFPTFSATQH